MKGEVVAVHIAPEASAPMQSLTEVEAIAGAGLAGDRYGARTGFYSDAPSPGGGRELTLIEEESIEAARAFDVELAPGESRRNVTTRGIRLNDLVGRQFTIGEVVCEGVRLCPPCNHLEEMTGQPVIKALTSSGGLRANVVQGGIIRVGDLVAETAVPPVSQEPVAAAPLG